MAAASQQFDVARSAICEVRAMVAEAIAKLDEAGAPADIAAHLDLALHRMDAETMSELSNPAISDE